MWLLEEENLRLKRLVVDLSLDTAMLQDVLVRWHTCMNVSGIYRPDTVPAKDKSVLRCDSAAARSRIGLLLPMTARCKITAPYT